MMKRLFSFAYPNVWAALKQTKKPIVLYGMGDGADKVLDEFARRHITATGVMASDDFCRYQEYRGYTVKKQSDFEKEYGYSVSPRTSMQFLSHHSVTPSSAEAADPFVRVADISPNRGIAFPKGSLCDDFMIALCFGSSLSDVMEHIEAVATQHEMLIPNVPVVGDSLMDEGFIERHHDEIEHAYALLADKESRRVFKGVLDFYYTGRLPYLKAIESNKDEAFHNILHLKNERYLDLGAYRGDTVDEFLQYTDSYEAILAVEPNPKNYQKLCEHISDIQHTEAIHAGIADKKGVMRIGKKAGRMPVLGDENGIEIPVITVDELDFFPTYIKVDIEGMESAMLRGAEQTIREQKPKLNLAAYHRTEDFFSLILRLHALNPDYQIYLCKHPYIPCWDLNIYAV